MPRIGQEPIDQEAIDQGGVDATIAWMVDGCRSAPEAGDVLTELCTRLVGCGVPLARGAVFIRTLHPEIMGRRFLWRPETGTEVSEAGFETYNDVGYIASPVLRVYGTRTGMRRRLADPACPMDFPILQELRDEGLTDYLVSPLFFSNGEVHVATWSSAAPGGFSDQAITALEAVAAPLARVAEVRSLRRVALNLLDTYVGGQAGTRILAGQICRGDIETIRAAIWLSDMRDFTGRADRMPPEDLIALLNRYFDCQVPAIRAHGGEVLKFMGDGLLAIFPIDGSDTASVCRAALAAARVAEAEVAAADWQGRAAPGAVRFGVALHLGEVLYGNIGSANRLDFTCIGPAVNLAARIEALSGDLGRTILASADFAACCPGELTALGAFALKGVAAPQLVYGLA
ncbi:MAG TPA: adenylate/guanylate cyclase domain-containing protein [Candidatus Binatia bacterium]|nr:adenylate/guanylate cyclase domain-containing protein [Candidatus Binatia bacterium]